MLPLHTPDGRHHKSRHAPDQRFSSDETSVVGNLRLKDAERRAHQYAEEIYTLKSEKASLEAQLRAVKAERDEALRDKEQIISNLSAELRLAEQANRLNGNDDYTQSGPMARALRRPPGRFDSDRPLGANPHRISGANDGYYHPVPVWAARRY